MNRYSRTSTFAGQSFNDLTPDLKEWVRAKARQHGVSEQELIDGCVKHYGSVKQGKIDSDRGEVTTRRQEELYRQSLGGNPEPTPIMLGAKPSTGERVTTVALTDNISIRIWGDKLASHHLFSFDFVDGTGRYIRTPPGIKIYMVAAGFVPGGMPVHSIEKSLELSDIGGSLRRAVDQTMQPDPNWETYLIPEGIKLRISHTGHVDSFLDIPTRQPAGHILQIQPYW